MDRCLAISPAVAIPPAPEQVGAPPIGELRWPCGTIGWLAHVHTSHEDRIVITGIGLITSAGHDRETAWTAVREGVSRISKLTGMPGIPDDLFLGATVEVEGDFPGQLKNISLSRLTAQEALADSQLEWQRIDPDRFGCSICAHMGDIDFVAEALGRFDMIPRGKGPWWEQWLPNTACSVVANEFNLRGPRLSNSTACASGTIAVFMAMRAIADGQCDIALAGSSQAIHPLLAAGFHNMRVLAYHDDPSQACRPFDAHRSGFVMGEGAGMLVLERLSHALDRQAPIYAELLGGCLLGDAHHMTSLDTESDVLAHLISLAMRRSHVVPRDITHINAHGTGTLQNDLLEARGIRQAFGAAANSVAVTANKSMLGHLVNASGTVELALTALAMRDGFAPPTMNLTHPDPACDLDCVPLVGRRVPFEHSLKLSIAFGGHLAALVVRRWNDAGQRASLLPLPLPTPLRRAA
jgi:3-oxoacyl-(acyl-carrier-protein) synthase